jgi:hypothetical protein
MDNSHHGARFGTLFLSDANQSSTSAAIPTPFVVNPPSFAAGNRVEGKNSHFGVPVYAKTYPSQVV